ncbi:glycosyltransferase [bacterium]|nr:glycosyltransferase [bacterium]
MSVSILIPCYNAERWITKCVESALAQTHPDKEVIVVDDGSTDESIVRLSEFGDRITLIEGPNRGGNFARNSLLEAASKDWLQFLDADDCLLPDKIEKQLAVASNESDLVYGPLTILQHDGDSITETVDAPDLTKDIYSQWINWRFSQTGTVLWKKKSLERIGSWNINYSCCQDNELCLRALKNDLKIDYCEHPGACYRLWSEGTVCRKDPARVVEVRTSLITELLEHLGKSEKITPEHRLAATQAHFEMARSISQFSLTKAVDYAKLHQRTGLFAPIGPAAPARYTLCYTLFGFRGAEKIAHLLR